MSLIIDDDYYNSMSSFIKEQSYEIRDAISTYMRILRYVRENGIKEGETAKALDEFISQCSSASDGHYGITHTGDGAVRYIRKYISDIDQADKDLY